MKGAAHQKLKKQLSRKKLKYEDQSLILESRIKYELEIGGCHPRIFGLLQMEIICPRIE